MSEKGYLKTLQLRRIDKTYGVKHHTAYYLLSAALELSQHPRDALKDIFLELIGRQARQLRREQSMMDALYASYVVDGADELYYDNQSGVVSRIVLSTERNPVIIATRHMDCAGVSIIAPNGVGHVHISPRALHPDMINQGEWGNIPLANTDFGAEIIKVIYGLAKNENWNLANFTDEVFAAKNYFDENKESICNMSVVITGGNASLIQYLQSAFRKGSNVIDKNGLTRQLPPMYVCETHLPEWGNNPKTVVVSTKGVLLKNENSGEVI